MSAILESIADLSRPEAAAEELQALNDRLASEPAIPPDISEAVRKIAAAIDETNLHRWEMIDPHHAVVVLHSAISAQRALEDPDARRARDHLRIALESIRQSLTAIAEREPVGDERSPKEIVQWLVQKTEVPQGRLAELFRVSARQFQRWASSTETTQPEAEDARKVRAVARIVNQLCFVLTPAAAIDWFEWPRDDLGGQTPAELLDDPQREPGLTAIAGAMRSTYAS